MYTELRSSGLHCQYGCLNKVSSPLHSWGYPLVEKPVTVYNLCGLTCILGLSSPNPRLQLPRNVAPPVMVPPHLKRTLFCAHVIWKTQIFWRVSPAYIVLQYAKYCLAAVRWHRTKCRGQDAVPPLLPTPRFASVFVDPNLARTSALTLHARCVALHEPWPS